MRNSRAIIICVLLSLTQTQITFGEYDDLMLKFEQFVSEKNLAELLISTKNNNNTVNGIYNIEVNDIVDDFLENLKEYIIRHGMDPVEMEDRTLKLFPVGSIKLTSGWLQDLSLIKRNGDVVISYHTSKKTMSFLVPLYFPSLLFTYKYHTKITPLSIKGDMVGKIDKVKIKLEIAYDIKAKTFSLSQLKLKDSGKVTVKFSGNLVDWVTNAMTGVVSTVLHPIIIRFLEAFVKSGANNVIDAVNAYIHRE